VCDASQFMYIAVCCLPMTYLSLPSELGSFPTGLITLRDKVIEHKTAIFRQINKERVAAHHDSLEFPDGRIVLLTFLNEDQQATVLQLPAEPKTGVESEAQRRGAYVGRIFTRTRPPPPAAPFPSDQ